MIRGFKIRLLPDKSQEEKLWQHVHAARAVWNWGLNYEMERFKNSEKHLSAFDMINTLTLLRKTEEYAWLNNVSSKSLSNILLDLGKAYDGFFATKPARYVKKKLAKAARTGEKLTFYDLEGHPKFKSKKDNDFRFPSRHESVYFKNQRVNIEKIGKIQYQTNYALPQGRGVCKISNPRIKYINKKWILSFGIDCESQATTLTDKSLGIDLGVKTLATASFGGQKIVIHNINKSKRMRALEKKKKHIQRNIARKYHTNGNYVKTKNIMKAKKLLQRVQSRITNKRHNYTHQSTHDLISLLPYRIVMEGLNVKGMMKNKHLSKAIQDSRFAEFIRQMKYKCEERGIEFILVGRWYPSSKTCSCCGTIKKDLKLKDRVFKCDHCGLVIDRDFNASLNLERYDRQKEERLSA